MIWRGLAFAFCAGGQRTWDGLDGTRMRELEIWQHIGLRSFLGFGGG